MISISALHRFGAWAAIVTICMPGRAFSQAADRTTSTDVVWALMQIHSLQLMRDNCVGLFPAESQAIIAQFDASRVPEFARALNYERSFPLPFRTREEQLRASGLTESEASDQCFIEFRSRLLSFDNENSYSAELLANRVQAIAEARQRLVSTREPRTQTADARIDAIVGNLVESSAEAHLSGDWSIMARLYEPGTFDCWADADLGRRYGFLQMEPIPQEATYELSQFNGFLTGDGSDFTITKPTHLLKIRYSTSHDWGRCGVPEVNRYPQLFFFLVERGDHFGLTHYCPSQMRIDRGIVYRDTSLDASQLSQNINRLQDDEWTRIPEEVSGDGYSPVPQIRLQQAYDFSYREAEQIVHYVCDPENSPSRDGQD